MYQESRPVLLLALATIIAVACPVDSSPAAPSPAAPSPGVSGPAASGRAGASVNWSTSTSLGPQFYVSASGSDTNDGSAAHPWRSLSRADQAARPGVTIHVLPATYPNENDTTACRQTTCSGRATAPIPWVSVQRWHARLTCNHIG